MDTLQIGTINWELIKISYELFGNSLPQLANEYNVALPLLEHTCQHQQWKPRALDTVETDDVQEAIEGYELLKQKALYPEILKCQFILLGKLKTLSTNLKETSPTAAKDLKTYADSLKMLIEHNEIIKPSSSKDGSGKAITVRIMNRVDSVDNQGPKAVTNGIEVQITDADGPSRVALQDSPA